MECDITASVTAALTGNSEALINMCSAVGHRFGSHHAATLACLTAPRLLPSSFELLLTLRKPGSTDEIAV